MALIYCTECCSYFDPSACDHAEYGPDGSLCEICVDDRDSRQEVFLEASALLSFAVEMSEMGVELSDAIKARCEATAGEMWELAKEVYSSKHGCSSSKDDADAVMTSAVQRWSRNWYAKYARSTGGDV